MQYDLAPLDVKELAKSLADEFKATIESSAEKSKALKISFGGGRKGKLQRSRRPQQNPPSYFQLD